MEHKALLQLLRLGGKLPCHREEICEETDDAIRLLYLQGFLVQNLLPGYYQLRNLLVRYLLLEDHEGSADVRPENLFRRNTNERVGQLLQDAESTLRWVLWSVFAKLGAEEVQRVLEAKQAQGELLATQLNKALLSWADSKGGKALRDDLGAMLAEQRKEFKAGNTLWAKVCLMMASDQPADEAETVPDHLRCIAYLTFAELSDVFMSVLEYAFSQEQRQDSRGKEFASRWRENLAKIQRLRNMVAHLRNVDFQDMEDMIRTLVSIRADLLGSILPAC